MKFIAICIFFLAFSHPLAAQNKLTAFMGVTLIDGTGKAPKENATVLVDDGKILAINPADIPTEAKVYHFDGKFMIPGLISSHAHVGYKGSVHPSNYHAENIKSQLERYARYGITTVASLGEDRSESQAFREVNISEQSPGRASLYTAGEIIYGTQTSEVRNKVRKNVEDGVDFIKIRVDRNRGKSTPMADTIYAAIIDESHKQGKMLMAHMYDLDLAKDLLSHGADFLAHSVRNEAVDNEFIQMLISRDVCYCPTLTRDLSTFVYGQKADFLNDPYFLKEFAPEEFRHLLNPNFQENVKKQPDFVKNKEALEMAGRNLKTLADAHVRIAMGTDSGMPDRFQGYFEQMEMEMMQDIGIPPAKVLFSATAEAATCLRLKDKGTLEPGKVADFLILKANPLEDIRNIRSIEAVYIGGEPIRLR